MTLLKAILILLVPSIALGSATVNHEASIMDLIFPAINFCIVFGFIILKIKKPVSEAFTKNSEDVAALYSLADEKYKEAQIKYDSYAKKLEQLDHEITKINDSSEADIKKYTTLVKEETVQTIKRMEKESLNKLETDKNQFIMKLHKDLIDKVVEQAKATITKDKSFQSKATSKLISSIS
jgi:F-type H+-transporting ATPase subunit b